MGAAVTNSSGITSNTRTYAYIWKCFIHEREYQGNEILIQHKWVLKQDSTRICLVIIFTAKYLCKGQKQVGQMIFRPNDRTGHAKVENNIKLTIVPTNMTNLFQPLDLTAFMKRKFKEWYSSSIATRLRKVDCRNRCGVEAVNPETSTS